MIIHHDDFWLNPGIQGLCNIQKKKKIKQCNPPHKLITVIQYINRIKNKNHFTI